MSFTPVQRYFRLASAIIDGLLVVDASLAQFDPGKSVIRKDLPMPSTAPLYLESEGYTSRLYLVNSLRFGIQVNLILYDMGGSLLTTKTLYMEQTASSL